MSRSRSSALIGRVLAQGPSLYRSNCSRQVAASCSGLHSLAHSTVAQRSNVGLPAILAQFRREADHCRHNLTLVRLLAGQAGQSRQGQQSKAERSVVSQQEQFDEITDKHIPQRPMGVVEGTSYSLVILAAIGFGIALLWTAVSSLLIQPKEYTCFNVTLDKLRDDPRVTVRLGTPISGYGQESRNRAARQRIPHRAYHDDNGTEHIQVQFHAKGPTGAALISADMYQDSAKQWQYAFLYVDVTNPTPQRLILSTPQY